MKRNGRSIASLSTLLLLSGPLARVGARGMPILRSDNSVAPVQVASDISTARVRSEESSLADVITRLVTIIGDTPRVDILTLAFSVRYADAKPGQLSKTIEGVRVPFVDLDTLIRSKQTGRPQDVADIAALERLRALQGSPKRRRR